MDGILVSFWETLFSGAMLVSGRLLPGGFKRFIFTLNIGEMIPNFDRRIFFIHGWWKPPINNKKRSDKIWIEVKIRVEKLVQPLWVSMPMPKNNTFSSLTFSTVKLLKLTKLSTDRLQLLKRWYLLPVTRSAPGYECCKIRDEISLVPSFVVFVYI